MTKDELLKIFDLATMQHTDYGYETLRSKVQEIAREALAEHAMQERGAWQKQLTNAQRNELKQIEDGTWEADRNG